MNVFFHVSTAIGVAVVLTDTTKIKSVKASIIPALFAFGCGVIIHGILDYLPHGYPFNAKPDAILGLLIISITTFLSAKKYRLIVGAAFLGSIFPDLLDLLPSIVNKYSGLSIFVNEYKFFPWHWKEYSGSIFTAGMDPVSALNHLMVILLTVITCWFRRTDMKRMFTANRKEKV